MSRPSSVSARNLSLTEELEKLEQSITLTLQEIDHNFSRAHRIVTSSILPVVEQYAEHSKGVWEGSKFWKQFFEASANVSLSGYEEQAASERSYVEGEDEDSTSQDITSSTAGTPRQEKGDEDDTVQGLEMDDDTITADIDPTLTAKSSITKGKQRQYEHEDSISSLLSSPSMAKNTPVAQSKGGKAGRQALPPSYAKLGSAYENLRRETLSPERKGNKNSGGDGAGDDLGVLPDLSTPRANNRLPNMTMTPADSSPFQPVPTTTKRRANNDPLLHRVLDKTYRVQATPLKHQQHRHKQGARHDAGAELDGSPFSSPDIPVPQLHTEIFSSPVRAGHTGASADKRKPAPVSVPYRGRAPSTPRTPGVSVYQTQHQGFDSDDEISYDTPPGEETTRRFTPRTASQAAGRGGAYDDDEDEDLMGDISPPKTMQFAVPSSRLLQTPAREASKKIVSNLLQSAGMDSTNYEDTEHFEGSEVGDEEGQSPSLVVGRPVGQSQRREDDTF